MKIKNKIIIIKRIIKKISKKKRIKNKKRIINKIMLIRLKGDINIGVEIIDFDVKEK